MICYFSALLVGAPSFLQSLCRKSGRRSMGGVSFPCFALNTTKINFFALKLLFSFLTQFAFVLLEEALVRLGLVKPTEEAYSAVHHQNPTNSVRSMDSPRSPNSSLVPAPVQVETTLRKNNLPVVEYADFISRFKAQEVDDVKCVVCLIFIEKSDEIRVLRNCSHVFHRECLDAWINKDRVTCPLCRSTL